MEGIYESEGVEEVISVYSGGKESNSTFEHVDTIKQDQTGLAASVEVYYNPLVPVSFKVNV